MLANAPTSATTRHLGNQRHISTRLKSFQLPDYKRDISSGPPDHTPAAVQPGCMARLKPQRCGELPAAAQMASAPASYLPAGDKRGAIVSPASEARRGSIKIDVTSASE